MDVVTYLTTETQARVEWTESDELFSVEWMARRAALRLDGRIVGGYWVTAECEGETLPEVWWPLCEVESRSGATLGNCRCRNCRD